MRGKGYLTGDIRTVAFPEEHFDAILHMSLEGEGTERLVEWAENKRIKRMLFTSSGAVYEQQTPYAIGKRQVEAIWPGVIARCFAFVGPKLQSNFAIYQFIQDALKGGPIVVRGSAIRSYLYTSDLAEWLITLLMEGEGIYDVGGRREIEMLELAELVRDVLCPTAEIHVEGSGGTRYIPDLTRAHIAGLRVKVSLEEAILRTAKAMTRQSQSPPLPHRQIQPAGSR